MNNPEAVVLLAPVVVFFLMITFVMYMIPLRSWIVAKMSGTDEITLQSLIAMRFRRIPPTVIVDNLIMGIQAGLEIRRADLESHHLAGGRVDRLVSALIKARKAHVELSYADAAEIDLAGGNILEVLGLDTEPAINELLSARLRSNPND